MYYLIHDTIDNDYNYLFSEDELTVTYSKGDWLPSISQTLGKLPNKNPKGNWGTLEELRDIPNIKFLCSSLNPITPNSHPELFI